MIYGGGQLHDQRERCAHSGYFLHRHVGLCCSCRQRITCFNDLLSIIEFRLQKLGSSSSRVRVHSRSDQRLQSDCVLGTVAHDDVCVPVCIGYS